MKKIIELGFTNYDPWAVFFCQQSTVHSRQQIQLPNSSCYGRSPMISISALAAP